jgi:O-antigen ligase
MLGERLLCLMVLVVSGNPAIQYFYRPAVIVLPAIVLAILFVQRRARFIRSDYLVLVLFFFLFFIQFVEFGNVVLNSNIAFIFKLATALFAVRVIANFEHRLVEVMFILAIISLVFFIPLLLGVDMPQLMTRFSIPFEQNEIQPSIHIGIHNYRLEIGGLVRNSGMFWEPGAFAGYLTFSMLFMLNRKNNHSPLVFWTLVITLLSTQSTTGYVTLSLIIVGYLWRKSLKVPRLLRYSMRFVSAILLPVIIIMVYTQLDFLERKITSRIAYGMEQRTKGWELSRYGNALYDFEFIKERPLMGWSMSDGTIRGEDFDILSSQGNGLTGAVKRLGLPVFLVYIWLTYFGFRKRLGNTLIGSLATLAIMLLLIGEQFLMYPLFLVLLFSFGGTQSIVRRAGTFFTKGANEKMQVNYQERSWK